MALKININYMNPPKPVQYAVMVVPFILIIGLVAFLVVMPALKSIKKLESEIVKQETEISKSQSMAAKLDELKEENQKLKEKLVELSETLPEEGEISSLLKQISDLAIDSGLEVLTWSPGTKRNHPSKIVYEVPINIALRGNFHRLGRFYSALTQLDRIVNISNFGLGGPKYEKGEISLNISLTAVTFTAVSEGGMLK